MEKKIKIGLISFFLLAIIVFISPAEARMGYVDITVHVTVLDVNNISVPSEKVELIFCDHHLHSDECIVSGVIDSCVTNNKGKCTLKGFDLFIGCAGESCTDYFVKYENESRKIYSYEPYGPNEFTFIKTDSTSTISTTTSEESAKPLTNPTIYYVIVGIVFLIVILLLYNRLKKKQPKNK